MMEIAGFTIFCGKELKKISLLLAMFIYLDGWTQYDPDRTTDSLFSLAKASPGGIERIVQLNTLSRELINQGSYKEARKYANEALHNALILSGNKNYPVNEMVTIRKEAADAFKNIGIAWWYQGNNDKALENYYSARKIYEEIGDIKGVADSYVTTGIIYDNQGSYEKALENYFYSLGIYEKLGDQQRIAMTSNNIGLIYKNQGHYEKALEKHYAALKIDQEIGNKAEIASDYNNIGICYSEMGDYEKGLKNHLIAVKIEKETGDKHGLALSYNNIGLIYYDQANMDTAVSEAERSRLYNMALENFFDALKIREEILDMQGIIVSYNSIGNVYLKQNRIPDAKNYSLKSLKMAEEIGWKERMMYASNSLSRADSASGNWKGAYEYHKLYSQIRDSIFNEESSQQIAKMNALYETEKKESQIRLLEKNKEIINAENKKQQLVIYSVSAGLFLLLILTGVIFKSLRDNRKKNRIITAQKQEVERAKQIIEHKHTEQTDSINYARRLQEAILPPATLFHQLLPESFVLYQPKDIVAGDFYWMEIIEDNLFIAAADCTGHGVPGAMVSVICSNALTRAVKEFELRDTGGILDKVTELVQETFEKSAMEVYDGMDISLLSFNRITGEVTWSGANNPLWYIADGTINEIKPDKQPVGKFLDRKPFSSHKVSYTKGSVFYLFTDGYPDQFGGPKEKKFMYKRFQNSLLSLSELPVDDQKLKLENIFTDWKGNLEQVDDVTVVGIRL